MDQSQIILYIVIALIGLWYVRRTLSMRGIVNYTGAEARQRVKEGSVLLDVRTAQERSARSIPGSLHIPLQELGRRIKELEKHQGREIIAYCASGSRSVSAAMQLKRHGFAVGNLAGGIGAWRMGEK